MNDEELGELFNKAISSLSSEAVDIIWPELKSSVENQVISVSIYNSASHILLASLLFEQLHFTTWLRTWVNPLKTEIIKNNNYIII